MLLGSGYVGARTRHVPATKSTAHSTHPTAHSSLHTRLRCFVALPHAPRASHFSLSIRQPAPFRTPHSAASSHAAVHFGYSERLICTNLKTQPAHTGVTRLSPVTCITFELHSRIQHAVHSLHASLHAPLTLLPRPAPFSFPSPSSSAAPGPCSAAPRLRWRSPGARQSRPAPSTCSAARPSDVSLR